MRLERVITEVRGAMNWLREHWYGGAGVFALRQDGRTPSHLTGTEIVQRRGTRESWKPVLSPYYSRPRRFRPQHDAISSYLLYALENETKGIWKAAIAVNTKRATEWTTPSSGLQGGERKGSCYDIAIHNPGKCIYTRVVDM